MMKLRTVTPRDSQPVSELILMAIEDLADQFTKAKSSEELRTRLQHLIAVEETRFSAEYGLLIEADGQIAGVGFAYPGKWMTQLTANTLQAMKAIGALYEVDEAAQLLSSKEANSDEYYIDNLAVFEGYRGKGYSRTLIEAFEKRAVEEGYLKIAILADVNNPKAKAIYEKMGYVSDGIFQVLGHRYDHLVKRLKRL